jgi:ABC-2 type transport system permease protein
VKSAQPSVPATPHGGRRRPNPLRVRRMVTKEFRQLFRDPKTKRIIFAAPVIQLLAFGYAVNTDVRNVATIVVDHDRSTESRDLITAFTASGYFHVIQWSDRSAAIGEALDRGQAVVGIEVPAGYAADLAARRSPAVQLLVDGTNSNTATVAQGYAGQIVQFYGARLAGPAAGAPGRVELRARAWFNPSLESRVYNVPAVVGVIVLMMCLMLTALGIAREREVGTLEQLLVSPLSPGELILGKTIPVAGIALLQISLVTTVALLWFGIAITGSVPALLVAAVLFIVAGLSAGLYISSISATQQEAFLSMYMFLLPGIILSGFLYPVHTMPTGFQYLTWLNPLRHFLDVVRAVFLKGAGFMDVWPSLGILLAMACGGLLFATRRFRATL